MADNKAGVSFDSIIQAERNRRKNEQLANQIFGRNRSEHNKPHRSNSRPPSLASRIGVAKTQRSSSTTSISSQRPNPPSRPSSTVALRDRVNRIASAINSNEQVNLNPAPRSFSSRGLSIKGKAGPFHVIASNFAPGTTAADIESALANDSADSEGHIGLLSCRITSEHPSVVAELVFSERAIADGIIKTYNNQRADGRVLRLSYKNAPVTTLQPLVSDEAVLDEQDIDMTTQESVGLPATSQLPPQPQLSSRYDNEREAADRERESSRRSTTHTDSNQDERTNVEKPGEASEDHNGSGKRDDDRDRDRERSRDHDRDRDRDRRYDDRYERRDERRDERDRERDRERERERDRDRRYDNRPPYGGRSSHYGNGVGMNQPPGGPGAMAGPRGGYGGFQGRGRMYSDDVMRGGRGGGMNRGGGSWRGYR